MKLEETPVQRCYIMHVDTNLKLITSSATNRSICLLFFTDKQTDTLLYQTLYYHQCAGRLHLRTYIPYSMLSLAIEI